MTRKTNKSIESILFLPEDRRVNLNETGSYSSIRGKAIEVDEQSLLAIALKNQIEIAHSCGGMGSCGTCLVRITGDLTQLQARNEIESEMACDRGYADHERLACQTTAANAMIVSIVNKISDEVS